MNNFHKNKITSLEFFFFLGPAPSTNHEKLRGEGFHKGGEE